MRDGSERWIFGLTAGSAAAVLASIAVAQILLVAALALWLIKRPVSLRWPSYFLPLGCLLAATLLSMAFSPDPERGFWAVRKFWLFSLGLLAANFVTTPWRAALAQRVLLIVAGLAAMMAVFQFVFSYQRFLETGRLADDPTILARITGPMGHWMTFGGEQLMVWSAAVPALATLGWGWLLPISSIAAALVLSFTRSVWIGAAAGLASVALFLPRRIFFGVLVPLVVVAAVASPLIYHRVAMSFGEQFAPDTSRMAMLRVGAQMIREHPLVGVGPERIRDEFPNYYPGADLDTFYYGHLHNNIVQIAAERGLLALTAFFWFVLELYRSLIQTWRTSEAEVRWIVLSGLAALTGFMASGLFEYNFGDSEVLLLLVFIVSAPLGVHRFSHVQEDPDR